MIEILTPEEIQERLLAAPSASGITLVNTETDEMWESAGARTYNPPGQPVDNLFWRGPFGKAKNDA